MDSPTLTVYILIFTLLIYLIQDGRARSNTDIDIPTFFYNEVTVLL